MIYKTITFTDVKARYKVFPSVWLKQRRTTWWFLFLPVWSNVELFD
mgnify:CR=1 FL=1